MVYVDRIENSIFSSNTFVITSDESKDVWLIDCGDVDKVIRMLPEASKVAGVFFTHTHFDHIYGINDLVNVFPDCLMYTSEYGAEAIRSSKMNLSRYHESPVEYKGDNLRVLKEGDAVQIYDNLEIHVIETPGHCPSCLSYMTDKWLFSGDSYIPGLNVVTNLPKADKVLAQLSVNRIKDLSRDRILFSGHGVVEDNIL